MQFTELMLLHTAAIFWNEPPQDTPLKAEGLRDFLLLLLNPDNPGKAALGVYAPAGQVEPIWLKDGKTATEWVDDAYATIWKPQAEALQAGQASSTFVIIDHRAELFLDHERLTACFQQAGIEETVPDNIYVGLSLTWIDDGLWLWLTLQLRISNYWPHNRRYAPLAPPDISTPPVLTKEQAREILYRDFWVITEYAFAQLRQTYFREVVVPLELTREIVYPPVFFYARPSVMLNAPEDFVSSTHLLALQEIVRYIAHTQDLLSAEVSGGLLEGNILTFRREEEFLADFGRQDQRRRWQSIYLLVPWLPAATVEYEQEVEDDACFVANQLTLCEFVDSARRLNQLSYGMQRFEESLVILSDATEAAQSLATELQRLVVFQRNHVVRKVAYEAMQQLHSSLFRLNIELLPKTDEVLYRKEEWERVTEIVLQYRRNRMAVQGLPRVGPLFEFLHNSRAHATSRRYWEESAKSAQGIRNNFGATTTLLKEMLERERREIRDSEDERQRLIGYGIAALTAVTVCPLLIGESSWNELKEEIQTWPGLLGWLFSTVYITPHSYWTALAMGLASILIVALIVTFVRRPQKVGGPPKYGKELSKMGKRITYIEHLIRNVEQDLKRQDIEVCHELLPVAKWLEWYKEPPGQAKPLPTWPERLKRPLAQFRPQPSGDYKSISIQVARLIIDIELITRLRVPRGLPRALCLCRYLIRTIASTSQTEEEFTIALVECGLTPEQAGEIKERAEIYKREGDWWGFAQWIVSDNFVPPTDVSKQRHDSPANPSSMPPLPPVSDHSVPVLGGSK